MSRGVSRKSGRSGRSKGSGRVVVEREGALAWLIFDHPERRNAISAEMWQAIPRLATELDADPEVRVVILRGAGDVAFVSGADISEFEASRAGAGARDYDESNARAFVSLARLRMPVIAMIHGFCVGGGCALSLTADIRWCAEDAVFAIPAARLGLGYSAGGIESLVQVVGLPAAKEIFFTARRYGAEEALHMGLVSRVWAKDQLEDATRKLATDIARNAPLTLRAAKRAFGEIARPAGDRDPGAVDEAIRACYESDDYAEGVRAFLEKRTPEFQGR